MSPSGRYARSGTLPYALTSVCAVPKHSCANCLMCSNTARRRISLISVGRSDATSSFVSVSSLPASPLALARPLPALRSRFAPPGARSLAYGHLDIVVRRPSRPSPSPASLSRAFRASSSSRVGAARIRRRVAIASASSSRVDRARRRVDRAREFARARVARLGALARRRLAPAPSRARCRPIRTGRRARDAPVSLFAHRMGVRRGDRASRAAERGARRRERAFSKARRARARRPRLARARARRRWRGDANVRSGG